MWDIILTGCHGLHMQVEVATFKQHISDTQNNQNHSHIRPVMISGIQEGTRQYDLQHRIYGRHHNMRNFELVGHNLVGMFAVRIKNILFQHQPVHNCKHTIHAVHRQKNDPAQVARLQDKRTQHVQHDKRHTHRTHIPGKTARPGAEIKEVEHQYRNQTHVEEVGIHKRHHKPIHVGKHPQHRQAVPTGNPVYAIHKVIRIDDTRAEHQCDGNIPPRITAKQLPLGKQQQHRCKVKHQPHLARHRLHVVHHTDTRNKRKPHAEPRIVQSKKQDIHQSPQVKDNTSATQGNPLVRTPRIRPIHYIQPEGHPEVSQLQQKQNKSNVNVNHDLFLKLFNVTSNPSRALTGSFVTPSAPLILALLTT